MSQAQVTRARSLLRRFHVRETNVRRRMPLSWVPVGVPVGGVTPSGKLKRQTVNVPRLGNPFLPRPHPLAPSSAEVHKAKAARVLSASTASENDTSASQGTSNSGKLDGSVRAHKLRLADGALHVSGHSNMIPARYSLRRQKELLKAARLLSTLPESEGGDPLALSRLPRSPKALLKLVTVQDKVGLGRAGVNNVAQQAKDKAAAERNRNRPVGVLEDIISASGSSNMRRDTAAMRAMAKKDLRLKTFLPAPLRNNLAAPDRFRQTSVSPEVANYIWVGRPREKSNRGLKVGFKLHAWEREAAFRRKNTEALVADMDTKIRKFLNRRKGKTVGSALPF